MIKIKADQCGSSKQSKRKYKNPCSVCSKNCLNNQQVIECTQCDNWVHRKCNGISKEEVAILVVEDDDIPFFLCVCVCTIHNNPQIFPFGYLSKSELLDLYGIDMPSQLTMLPSFTVHSKLTKMPKLGDFDMDENLVHAINSNYISMSDLSSLKLTSSAFSLLHMNIRSFPAHFDELLQLLGTFKFNFDVIGISETKEKLSDGFLSNVTLPSICILNQQKALLVVLHCMSDQHWTIKLDRI